MEKMMTVWIYKDNGDLWKMYTNVPKSALEIVNGFVMLGLDDTCYMYATHKIGSIVCERQ